MIIIPLPWSMDDLEVLAYYHDLFKLGLEQSVNKGYLIVQHNTLTWIQQGTVAGKAAYQIRSKSTTMNDKTKSIHSEVVKEYGNVGFLGNYESIEDAIQKIFPKTGYCVTNMQFIPYSGQSLKGHKHHFSLIQFILCLMYNHPQEKLDEFLNSPGWGTKKSFTCDGTWRNMKLYVDGKEVSSLEEWFSSYCSSLLGKSNTSEKEGGYIATAVYGSYDCPEVWTLRRFRDKFLRKHIWGQLFIRLYYAISPTMVLLFGKKKYFKRILKPKLDKLVYRLKQKGYESTNYYDDFT